VVAFLAITGAAANPALATTDGVLASPAAVHALVIENFNGYTSGSFPTTWKVRGDRGQAENVYRVGTENGSERFLAARANHSSVMIGLDWPFEPTRYPFMRWRWRVRQLPTGGDERASTTNDSAAGVYVIFPGRLPFTPKVLKYVWSARAPVGLRQPSPGYSNTKIIVIESGLGEDADAWRTAVVNVREDYTALFGAPPPGARGIGLLTDADDTGSLAEADYATFELLSRLPDGVEAPAAATGFRAGTVSH
jgi:hypothetical protein